jgi:hypothetical protein
MTITRGVCCTMVVLALSNMVCAQDVSLPAGTEISVRITEDLTSLTHFRGETLTFELAQDVVGEGRVLIGTGSEVRAQIVHAVRARAPARAGILTIELQEGTAIDGQVVRLTGVYTRRGPRKLARAILRTALLGLLSLSQNGEEARFTKGEIVVVRTKE